MKLPDSPHERNRNLGVGLCTGNIVARESDSRPKLVRISRLVVRHGRVDDELDEAKCIVEVAEPEAIRSEDRLEPDQLRPVAQTFAAAESVLHELARAIKTSLVVDERHAEVVDRTERHLGKVQPVGYPKPLFDRAATLGIARIPARFVPPGSFASPARLLGATTAVGLPRGSYLTAAALAPANDPRLSLRPGELR